MYDIKPLEADWNKYQLNKRKPWYLFLILFVLILFVLWYLLSAAQKENNIFDEIYQNMNMFSKQTNVKKPRVLLPKILVNGSVKNLEVMKERDIISKVNKNTDDILVDIPILDLPKNTVNTLNETRKDKKVYIDIFETTSISAYEDVEERFKQSGDIDDALFLAKSYYKKGNFEKSEYWALEVNKLDSSLEESFFIFVKSKSKLGKMNEAISILNTYLKQTNSKNAKVLLEKLKNNKL